MSLAGRLASIVPASLARLSVPLAVGGIVLLLAAGVAVAALVSPGSLGLSATRISDTSELPEGLQGGPLAEDDADRDGLSDALENYVYGTHLAQWDSSGTGIPDGWLVEFGFDPLDPLLSERRGAAPVADLPPAYDDGYPIEYTPTLREYYAYGLPAGYVPGAEAPWWRSGPRADPADPDQTGTGVPTGWLVHHGLPLDRLDADAVAPGSKGNLTVREAFTHDTDPMEADSDGDGLLDWAEIHVHLTDPSKYSTASTGIADGWLVHFGLNAFDVATAGQDPDLDGLTNLEEFFFSLDAFRADVDREGVALLNVRGLDPLEWETGGNGIPDGWFVRYGIDPFAPDLQRVIARASDFPGFRAHVPESVPPALRRAADLEMRLVDAYAYGRPSDWNESQQGVWWGGTNPATGDTDGDGLPDPVEALGWYANVTDAAGRDAKPRVYLAVSDPLKADTDEDGLTDVEEYLGRSDCGVVDATPRAFAPTDPRLPDTALSGLSDHEKVCGVVRGSLRYDVPALDPTRQDSAGDLLKDGARLAYWHQTYARYLEDRTYAYEGSAYTSVTEWTQRHARFAGMDDARVVAEFRPDGDVDGDGVVNLVDPDPSGGLVAKPGVEPVTSVFFLGGPEIDPSLYDRLPEYRSTGPPHAASDPANPDTDGDGLPDAWETLYGRYDGRIDGWDLDPSKADSNGNGVLDGDDNNDGDEVRWHTYAQRGGRVERVTPENRFALTNALEMLAKTDPNEVSTKRDGVPDAWKVFWGARLEGVDTYPNLFSSSDPRIGDLSPLQRQQVLEGLSRNDISPELSLLGKGNEAKVAGYVRLVDLPANARCDDLDAAELASYEDPARGELLPDPRLREGCVDVRPVDAPEKSVVLLEGVLALSYRREVEFRTNPYLTDTDGDLAPDAWEVLMADRARDRLGAAVTFPSPTIPDAGSERADDEDVLDLAQECSAAPDGVRCDRHVFEREGVAYGVGSDPLLTDTDGDGFDDGVEANAGKVPVDPSSILSTTDDTDGDGVFDFRELTGWDLGAVGASGQSIKVKTDPQDVDTDGDGLLDGETQLYVVHDAGNVTQSSKLSNYNVSGIRFRLVAPGDAQLAARNASGMVRSVRGDEVRYLGEKDAAASFGARPDRLDASGSGAPDGWRVVYGCQDATAAGLREAYRGESGGARIPSWWDEARHGTWWWGDEPTGCATASPLDPADLDSDGLHDASGEDPFPSLHANALVAGGTRISDPRAVEAYVEAGPDAEAVRLRAQSVGDGAGDPLASRLALRALVGPTRVPVWLDRAPVSVVNVTLASGATPVGDGSYRIVKAVPFVVSGSVLADERVGGVLLNPGPGGAPVGVPNRTVHVGFFGPDRARIVGAGFTDANGSFRIAANITSVQTVAIPPALRGAVLLGAVDGSATILFDPASVEAGETTRGMRNALVVWVANTSSEAPEGSPTRAALAARLRDVDGVTATRWTNATGFAASAPVNVTVRSDTRWATTLATSALNGRTLVGDVQLLDTSGGGMADKLVYVNWTGVVDGRRDEARHVVVTDRSGVVNLTALSIPVAVRAPDRYALTATFPSNDPDDLSSSSRDVTIDVRNPTTLAATLDRGAVVVGDALVLSGRLETATVVLSSTETLLPAPVAGAAVRATLGGLQTEGQTNDRGEFTLRFSAPSTLSAGAQSVLLAFDGTAVAAPSETTVDLTVKRTSEIVGLQRIEGSRAFVATLNGRLVDTDGKGFPGSVTADSSVGRLATGVADAEGRFTLKVPLRFLPLGTQSVRVSFAGDASHAPAENLTTARVTSVATLQIVEAPSQLVRGELFGVRARLLDDEGAPIVARAIGVSWRGAPVGGSVTDASGEIRFTVPTDRAERANVATLGLVFAPEPTSSYRGASAAADVRVKAGVTLVAHDQDVARGPVALTGELTDDEGRPVAGAVLAARVGDSAPLSVTTARNGTFALPFALAPDHPLGPLAVTVRYSGTDAIASANATAQWLVRSPAELRLATLGPFVRGEPAPIEGRILDDAGAPVAMTLRVLIGEVDVGVVSSGPDGRIFADVDLPADLPRGPATLRLVTERADAQRHLPVDKALPIVVKIKPKVDLQLPALAVRGFSFTGELTLKDDHGEPLRNTTFAFVVGKTGAVQGRTDSDGRATIAATAPLTGEAVVALTVRGGEDVVASTASYPAVRVVGPATPLGYAALVVAALVVLAVVAAVVVATILRRRQLTEARDILEDAIRELLAGNEYAGTIFLAYRRFSAHLSRHGFTEKESDTPREFAVGVRKALPIGAVPLRSLIGLFEEARYSDHTIGSEERDRAVESLATVRNELDRMLGRKAVAA